MKEEISILRECMRNIAENPKAYELDFRLTHLCDINQQIRKNLIFRFCGFYLFTCILVHVICDRR